MLLKSHIALTAALTLAVADDIRMKIRNHRQVELLAKQQGAIEFAFEAVEAADKKLEVAGSQIQYLCHVLNENGVEVDEFDLIALNYHN